jgi:hypothetical protein
MNTHYSIFLRQILPTLISIYTIFFIYTFLFIANVQPCEKSIYMVEAVMKQLRHHNKLR